MQYYTEKLIALLHNKTYLSCEKLASVLEISEKTVRKKITEANEEIQPYGARIVSRQKRGCCLEISDPQRFWDWKNAQTSDQGIPQNAEDRVRYILVYLLCRNDYAKLDDLSRLMYVSRNTLTSDLKRVRDILKIYDLEIVTKPHYGIRIAGTEFNQRRFISNYLIKYRGTIPQQLPNQPLVKNLIHIVKQVSMEDGLLMSECAFECFILHLYVACDRIRARCAITGTPELRAQLIQEIPAKLLRSAQKLTGLIQREAGISFAEDEMLYIALHMSGKVASKTQHQYENMVISSKIDKMVLGMLTAVYEGNGLDFRRDLELRMSLNQHMVPMDIRMRYHLPLQNPLLDNIKKNYPLAYTVASLAADSLKVYYDRLLPEDEIGYIAILFALSIEKQNSMKRQKKNILIVCMSGQGSSQLFLYKFRITFGDYINRIYESNVFELQQFDFRDKDIDYIFTTVPINQQMPVPIFEISVMFEKEEAQHYWNMFRRDNCLFVSHYYSPELFLPHLSAQTKEEALEKIIARVSGHRNLPEDYLASVMLREERGQTDFGNLIAIPHAYRIIGEQRFVAVAVLEKPVWWGHNPVQIVFLLCMAKTENPMLEEFYQSLTNFMFDEPAARRLIENPTFETLIQCITGEAGAI